MASVLASFIVARFHCRGYVFIHSRILNCNSKNDKLIKSTLDSSCIECSSSPVSAHVCDAEAPFRILLEISNQTRHHAQRRMTPIAVADEFDGAHGLLLPRNEASLTMQ